MNHYPKHIGDWMTATAHLTEVEECMYSRLVDQYYARESPLPGDVVACCRLVRASSAQARKAVATVLREFFKLIEGLWRHKRCDAELAKYKGKSAVASASALEMWTKRNANADANASANADANALALAGENSKSSYANQNQEPEPLKPKPTPKPPPAAPAGIRAEVWDSWVKHRGKKLTPDAVRLQTAKLAELQASGNDPNAVIEQSICNGWAGLFELRNSTQRPAKPTDRRADNIDILTGRKRDERTIEGIARRVDSPALCSPASDLRQPRDDDVGSGGPGRSAASLG